MSKIPSLPRGDTPQVFTATATFPEGKCVAIGIARPIIEESEDGTMIALTYMTLDELAEFLDNVKYAAEGARA
jgi:hypothetical protein